jgi:2-oxoglutarate ferredoxin oxidoreductase subunit gamma
MVNRKVEREDINVVSIPANDIAEEIGSSRSANLVMLGALLGNMDLLPVEAVETALEAHMPARHKKFLEANKQALRKGAAYHAEQAVKA